MSPAFHEKKDDKSQARSQRASLLGWDSAGGVISPRELRTEHGKVHQACSQADRWTQASPLNSFRTLSQHLGPLKCPFLYKEREE